MSVMWEGVRFFTLLSGLLLTRRNSPNEVIHWDFPVNPLEPPLQVAIKLLKYPSTFHCSISDQNPQPFGFTPKLSTLVIMEIDTSSTVGMDEEYDFIIVGGGTAGLVVASRLTENPKLKVLVLETGPSRPADPRILTPGLVALIYDDPDYDWCFFTVPQVYLTLHLFFTAITELTISLERTQWPRHLSYKRKSLRMNHQMKIVYTNKPAFEV